MFTNTCIYSTIQSQVLKAEVMKALPVVTLHTTLLRTQVTSRAEAWWERTTTQYDCLRWVAGQKSWSIHVTNLSNLHLQHEHSNYNVVFSYSGSVFFI